MFIKITNVEDEKEVVLNIDQIQYIVPKGAKKARVITGNPNYKLVVSEKDKLLIYSKIGIRHVPAAKKPAPKPAESEEKVHKAAE